MGRRAIIDALGHHVAAAEEVVHPLERLGDAVVPGAEHLGVLLRGLQAPLPRVLERRDLRLGLLAALFGEQHVIVGVGVEGRVEVDQVNSGIGQVATQDVEVVAVIEDVRGEVGSSVRKITRRIEFQTSVLGLSSRVWRRRGAVVHCLR